MQCTPCLTVGFVSFLYNYTHMHAICFCSPYDDLNMSFCWARSISRLFSLLFDFFVFLPHLFVVIVVYHMISPPLFRAFFFQKRIDARRQVGQLQRAVSITGWKLHARPFPRRAQLHARFCRCDDARCTCRRRHRLQLRAAVQNKPLQCASTWRGFSRRC